MLLITVSCWKIHLQSRALWWKKNSIFVVCFRFSKFFHLTKLFKLLNFFKFNCFNLRKRNTNLYVPDFSSSKKKKKNYNLATLNYLHFDETDMLFWKIINLQTPTLCSNLEIRQTLPQLKEHIIGSTWVIFAVNLFICLLFVSDFLNSSIWPNCSSFWSSSNLIVLI